MAQVFYRKRFSSYLGEQRAIDDIITSFVPDGPVPSPTPSPTPGISATPTPTPSITPTITPTPTITNTPSITPTNTGSPTPTPTRTPAPACDITYTELPSPTPSPTPTITPSPGPAFDPDAEAYLNAVILTGGTLDATMSAATNTLFTDLKSNGLYSKLDVLYLMLGSTAASNALNAIRTAPQYDITWNNTALLTFGISGVTGGGAGYGNTNYNPNGNILATDLSWGIYQTAGNFQDEVYSFGAFDGTNINNHRYDGGNTVGLYGYSVGSPRANITTVTNRNGSYIATFDSFGVKYLYKNITSISTSGSTSLAAGGSAQVPNQPYYLFTLNLNGSPYSPNFFTGRIQSWYIGDYLTPSEVNTIDGLINTFQTALGRNTY